MLHFQYGETGATLRASEVKPKLDRFLIHLLGGEENVKKKHADWLIGDHFVFGYKMCFSGVGARVSNDSEEEYEKIRNPGYRKQRSKIPRSYFGNMAKYDNGMGPDEKVELVKDTFKELLRFDKGVDMRIICFKPELLKFIDEHITAFFLIHNFGTRQNKGFGSFSIDIKNGERHTYDPSAILSEYKVFNAQPFYYLYTVNYTKPDPRLPEPVLMDEAGWIYSLLKSGINRGSPRYSRAYIYQYFHDKGIRNEKAWLKQNGIAPIRNRNDVKKNHENDLCKAFGSDKKRYVRALLGLGDRLEYLHDLSNTRLKWTITISPVDTEINRCASPITFKIVGKKLFMLVFEPNPGILGKEFIFEGKEPGVHTRHRGRVSVPAAAEFKIKDIFDGFVKYVNTNSNSVRNCRTIDSGNYCAGLPGYELKEVR